MNFFSVMLHQRSQDYLFFRRKLFRNAFLLLILVRNLILLKVFQLQTWQLWSFWSRIRCVIKTFIQILTRCKVFLYIFNLLLQISAENVLLWQYRATKQKQQGKMEFFLWVCDMCLLNDEWFSIGNCLFHVNYFLADYTGNLLWAAKRLVHFALGYKNCYVCKSFFSTKTILLVCPTKTLHHNPHFQFFLRHWLPFFFDQFVLETLI